MSLNDERAARAANPDRIRWRSTDGGYSRIGKVFKLSGEFVLSWYGEETVDVTYPVTWLVRLRLTRLGHKLVARGGEGYDTCEKGCPGAGTHVTKRDVWWQVEVKALTCKCRECDGPGASAQISHAKYDPYHYAKVRAQEEVRRLLAEEAEELKVQADARAVLEAKAKAERDAAQAERKARDAKVDRLLFLGENAATIDAKGGELNREAVIELGKLVVELLGTKEARRKLTVSAWETES